MVWIVGTDGKFYMWLKILHFDLFQNFKWKLCFFAANYMYESLISEKNI